MHATMFVAFTLSAGIPIMMHCMCAYLVLAFFADRLALLRLVERPPPGDASLSFQSLEMLPWATVLHFAFGVWFFAAAGQRSVVGAKKPITDGNMVLIAENAQDLTFGDQFNVHRRILKMASLPQFVAFLVTLTLLLGYYLQGPVRRYSGLMCGGAGGDPELAGMPAIRDVMPKRPKRGKGHEGSVVGSGVGSGFTSPSAVSMSDGTDATDGTPGGDAGAEDAPIEPHVLVTADGRELSWAARRPVPPRRSTPRRLSLPPPATALSCSARRACGLRARRAHPRRRDDPRAVACSCCARRLSARRARCVTT